MLAHQEDRPQPTRNASQNVSSERLRLTEEEVDALIENFAKEDDLTRKTWTRRVVENFLMKYKWYFPRRDIKGAPSLSTAYAYYEHITLPRHFAGGEQTAEHVLRRAEPGESQSTDLYNPLKTPSSSFIEWGIGVDLYFSSVRIMSMILLLAGLLNIYSIYYYGSTEYSPNGKNSLSTFSLVGTAICTTGDWVVCAEGCTQEGYSSEGEDDRFGIADDGTVLVVRNGCDDGSFLQNGMVNWITLLFLGILMALVSLYLKAREVRFDEDKLTSTDYSVIVKNPPPDAYDPDEWRDFFAQFAEKQVTVVTVGLNNESLLNLLLARRVHRHNLRLMLPKGTDMDDEDQVRSAVARLIQDREAEPDGCIMRFLGCAVFPFLRIFNMFLPPEVLVDRVFRLTDQIKELQGEKYTVSNVFVTFETEEGQRAALAALSVGKLDAIRNNTANSAPSAIFRDRVLKVEEPTEPSAVRWMDLSASTLRKIILRILNLLITLGVVSFSGYLVAKVRENLGPGYSGPLVSVFNSIIPQIVKLLMIFEPHTTEGSFQTSLYLKITLFRWVNTAVLTKLITPFTSTVSPERTSVLPTINSILWSELWLVPGLRLLDLWGNIQKHVLAPRARNQELMNLNFQGTFYNLGERYTDLTKVLFLCFFYSALFPSTFFFGAAILFVQYYTDKYCLMRIWAWRPFIGPELARFSRRYFFSGSVLAFALVSAYTWAQFPYDNVCDPDTPIFTNAAREYFNVQFANSSTADVVTVSQDTPVVACSQSWREVSGFSFPPTKRIQPVGLSWMSDSQETLTSVYGWTAVALLVGFLVFFFGSSTINFLLSWFRGIYHTSGQNQRIDFSTNLEIFAYVPQVKLKSLPFPLLACNVDNIDKALIGWNDPAHSYDVHNMIFDVPWQGMPRQKAVENEASTRGSVLGAEQEEVGGNQNSPQALPNALEVRTGQPPIFAVVKHYPPEWRQRELKLS